MADIRTLIVDDEPVARAGMRKLLEDDPDIEIVGEAGDGAAAVAAVNRLRPDLLLLDIQMPELDGFQVLEAIGPAAVPAVVFVTAYDQFAVKAFEVQALDYVLKPFEDDRFYAVLERARQHLRRRQDDDLARRLGALLQSYEQRAGTAPSDPPAAAATSRYLARISVKGEGRVAYLPVGSIDWIEAADYYSRLHVGETTHLIRESMSSLEEQLDPARFVRVHRSAIVNVERVKEIRLDYANRPVVVLRSGTRLPLSRSRREELERVLTGRSDGE
jgi:two-component system, LytTR family, response regulator